MPKSPKLKNHLSYSAAKYLDKCPAKQLAIDKGEFVIETSKGMLEGKYLEHKLCPSSTEAPEGIYKGDGSLYAHFAHIDSILNRVKKDTVIKGFLEGDKQVELKFKVNGVNWISIPDIVSHKNKRIVDIKKTKSITDQIWSNEYGTRVPFYTEYGYEKQAAIAREGIFQQTGEIYECYLIAISNEKPFGDYDIFKFRHEDLLNAMANMALRQKQMVEWRTGEVTAPRCEKCDYCKLTKKATIKTANLFEAEGEAIF